MPKPVVLDAVIFDFDGTIIDTETPVYESWNQTYIDHGAEPLDRDEWVSSIGRTTQPFDLLDELERRVGSGIDRAQVTRKRTERRLAMVSAEPIRPGVIEWMDRCDEIGLKLAIGSSSPISWVRTNLTERGLAERFQVISCAGDGVPGKPDPAVYRRACEMLAVEPGRALAIEDSPTGVTGAIAAGLSCLAAPGPMTQGLDFGHATAAAPTLADHEMSRWLVSGQRP